MITTIGLSLLAAAALPFANAQEYTSCNPLHGTCPSDPALGTSLTSNFAGISSLPAGWSAIAGSVSHTGSGTQFVINKQGDAPTIQTDNYFFFGYVEIKMQAAAGQGIVSSIVMQSDDLDEVDWEFTGTDTTQTQTNYFGKGITGSYDRAVWYPVSSPQTSFHTYAVNWTSSQLTWLIDGVAVRTLNYNDAAGGSQFPQTPMRLKIGIWAGGDPTNGQGTIQWAGGPTNYADVPFTMSLSSVKIVNYSPASSYAFGDTSGSWTSIKVTGGAAGSNNGAAAAGGSSSESSTAPVTSGSAVIKVSTAASPVSTNTAGAVTHSAALTEIPLLSQTASGSATASSTGSAAMATTTRGANSTVSRNGTSTSPAVVSASGNAASSNSAFGSTLGAAALAFAIISRFL